MGKRKREKGLCLALQCNKNSCVMWHKWVIRYDIMCTISIYLLHYISVRGFGSHFFLSLKSFSYIFSGYQLKCPEIPLQPISFASSKYLPLIDDLLNWVKKPWGPQPALCGHSCNLTQNMCLERFKWHGYI